MVLKHRAEKQKEPDVILSETSEPSFWRFIMKFNGSAQFCLLTFILTIYVVSQRANKFGKAFLKPKE
jgi:hypothetical protein